MVMKKIVTSLLIVFTLFTCFKPSDVRAELPAKARAMLTMVAYGAAGGALLGAASMAFGTSTRAVFQGASLGLYAGLLFGTYVLVSHHQMKQGQYDDSSSPYKDSRDVYSDEYQSDEGGSEGGNDSKNGFFDRMQTIQTKFGSHKKGGQMPPIYLNLFQYNF